MYAKPRLLIAGDSSIVLELGDTIDEDTSDKVRSIALAIESCHLAGITGLVPTYRSILINYDPMLISFDVLRRLVTSLSERASELASYESKLVVIPVAYGGEFGPDLPYVAESHDTSQEEIVELHSSARYLVYMLGFTPGFAYLGGLPERIATPRLATPRPNVPPGSVGIGGHQTGVYPISSPGGWRIIGRTPAKLFDPLQKPPTLLAPGDHVRFQPISTDKFFALTGKLEDS